ncbi:MAG: cyclase family protein [Thermoanaerobaculia bacterium]
MKYVDLSHVIADGMITYPGLPAPVITDHLSREASEERYAAGTTFQIARINMVANTGTYLDAPSHRYENGPDLSQMQLSRLANIPGIVVDAAGGRRALDRTVFRGRDVRGKAVLIRTGWSSHFGTPAYGSSHPFLTADAGALLVEEGAALVGIDSLNIDDIATGERPIHSMLLAGNIPIVEHLTNLEALPNEGFRFFAVPPRVRGMGSFPVRAFAIVK